MKTNCWLMMAGLMIATSAMAQDTNALPPIPAPNVAPSEPQAAPTPAPAPIEHKKAPAHKRKPVRHHKHVAAPARRSPLSEPTVSLTPGPAEVAVNNLNVRGQAGFRGEVIAHAVKGETVNVLEQINLDKHRPDEPAQWAKIALPSSAHVWVSAQFIDKKNHTVLPHKLNLRAGPSENYGVLGTIDHGTAVNEIHRKGGWIEIEPPANAYAFVAAMYLKQEASGNMANNPPPSTETETTPTPAPVTTPTPPPTEVTPPQPIVSQPPTQPVPPTPPPTTGPNPGTEMPNMEVDTNLPPVPRVVTHEGVVRPVSSIIEPTAYELYDPRTDLDIDYLYSTSTNLDLSRYNNLRIIVTGTEGIAKRWPNTPVLTIQRILVVSTNEVSYPHAASPRGKYH